MSSILQDIQAIQEKIKAMPPFATAFYFVDRDVLYYKFTHCVKEMEQEPSLIYLVSPFRGVGVFRFRSTEHDDRSPWFCRVPGIWAAMSDGTVRQFTDDEL